MKKQGANDRLDESLGERRGNVESTKSQSLKLEEMKLEAKKQLIELKTNEQT